MAFRVLLLTDADVFAGTEQHILCLAKELHRMAVDVAIGSPADAPLARHAAATGIETVAVAKGGTIDRPAVRRVREFFSVPMPAIAHAHNGRTAFIVAQALRGYPQARGVATQHFLTPHHATKRGLAAVVYRAAHAWVNRKVHRFVAISEAVRREMLRRDEATPDRIDVVLNGLPDPMHSSLADSLQTRQQLGLTAVDRLLVCAARLQPEKDVITLVEAMALLRSKDIHCVIAGEGEQREPLERRINELGLGDRVRLLGFRQDVLSLINAADLFVLPSLAEPFGLVLLEAMALSKPVIATQSGGPPEIVEKGRTGLLVPPSSPAALADAIDRVLGLSSTKEMGLAGRQRYLERFTAERMAREMIQVYERALAAPH